MGLNGSEIEGRAGRNVAREGDGERTGEPVGERLDSGAILLDLKVLGRMTESCCGADAPERFHTHGLGLKANLHSKC